jgi:DNA-binding NtrC family response regulator
LIVDDESCIRFGIRDFLESHQYEVEEAGSGREAETRFRTFRPEMILVDYLLPDGNALDLLSRLKETDPSIPVVILTGHGSIDLAVRAIKEGAEHFLTKPVELPTLLVIIRRIMEHRRNRQKHLADRTREARLAIDPFLGASPAIRHLAETVGKVVSAERPILIQGETGTGKGVLARWLHSNGPRAEEPFVDLNCAGLSKEFLETELFGHAKGAFTGAVSQKAGLLEVAHQGTLFLDEIGDIDLQVQPKLLKVLEEQQFRRLGDVQDRQVDLRLIAATHHDLTRRVQEKSFRSDLYFRINTISLHIPPLRERREDIPLLACHLLERCAADLGRGRVELSPEAERALREYAWPGNIRELRNVLERAALLSDQGLLRPADLRFDMSPKTDPWRDDSTLTLEAVERRHIERVLREEGGQVERAAARLGVPRSSLYQKIKRHRIILSGD